MSNLFELLRRERLVFPEPGLPENGRGEIPAVALAFAGDTLFDLYLRTGLIGQSGLSPRDMHRQASSFANAASQARMAQRLLPLLTPEEERVLKHARNQRSVSVPKNASEIDYKWATGLEALFGWLYVNGQDERLFELMRLACESLRAGEEEEKA